ncbi:unnamed protein product [Symbiodinium natans]|uniref:Uncharacterized protein n=1 Tax=Symbiodinium natans TaxID=878477 RepID=A0A812SZ67_9DINO|nr:unnamed protein product [Symbiodinium natans]
MGHAATAQIFHEDLESWISEVSEVFHYRVFVIELVGQMLYTVLGPLSIPLLLIMYGGRIGLINRGFWPARHPSFVVQFILWMCLFASIMLTILVDPPGVMLIEKKFALMCLLMRNAPIATKYAYCSTETWTKFNREIINDKYKTFQNMLPGWYVIPEENFQLQAEVAFVGVIGSRAQRSEISVKFLPWPRSEYDLLSLRKRVDVSSKTMFFAPTGDLLRPNSRTRKAARRRITAWSKSESPQDDDIRAASMEMTMTMTRPWGCKAHSAAGCQVQMEGSVREGMKLQQSRKEETLVSPDGPAIATRSVTRRGITEKQKTMSKKDLKIEAKMEQERLEQERLEREKKLFKTAEAGGEVAIEDLFLYFLRAIVRSEKVIIPPLVRINLVLTLIAIFIPSFLRWRNTGWFLGPETASTILVVGFWPSNFLCMLSSLSFIAVGGVDMWRRRSLMRSCAAMLSVSREFRRHCPAEVDMLPVLDLSDVNTVAGWRKLRQLCTEWGKFYHLRVRAFSAEFFFFLILILGDLVAGMLIEDYTEFSGVNLASLVVAGTVSISLMVSIFVLVYLGNEVNQSAERHRFLLNRSRTLMTSMRYRTSTCTMPKMSQSITGVMPPDPSPTELEQAAELISCLGDELESEGKVLPLTLLGMPLGWSLLSVLQFIPIGVMTTLTQFCGNSATAYRCLN